MSRARILADYVSGGTTAAEFDYLDGVTSNIQTQFTAKAPLASPAFTGTPTGITAAHITSGVLPVGVTGGSGLTALGTVTAGNISHADIVYPAGHILKVYSHTDATNALYASGTDTTPLGGASGLRAPANGSNITTTVLNSKFWIFATVSSGWAGTAATSFTQSAADFGLFIHRTNVEGSTTTRLDVGTTNQSQRGGDDTWFTADDQNLGYNPYDTRCFVLANLDSPNAAAGSTFYYSIGMAQRVSDGSGFAYNRVGSNASSGASASTITVMEIAP